MLFRSGGLVLKLATGLQLQQATGHNAVVAADGNSLILLQRRQLAALLTGDISLLLALGNGGVLQLVESEQISAGHDVKGMAERSASTSQRFTTPRTEPCVRLTGYTLRWTF